MCKPYGALTVMPDFNLDNYGGESLVLGGPSGCRKSTLLRMIAGLKDCSYGTISIADIVVKNLPASKQELSMML